MATIASRVGASATALDKRFDDDLRVDFTEAKVDTRHLKNLLNADLEVVAQERGEDGKFTPEAHAAVVELGRRAVNKARKVARKATAQV